MSKTILGWLKQGDLFEFEGNTYKADHYIENTTDYVSCQNLKTGEWVRFHLDILVERKDADNE